MSNEREKLSESVKFRIPSSLGKKIRKLIIESHWTESQILRTGLETYWTDIEAHVLARAGKRKQLSPEVTRKVHEVQALGLDPVEILTTAAEQKLTSEATA